MSTGGFMKTNQMFPIVFVIVSMVSSVSLVQAELSSEAVSEQQTTNLKIVDKADALAPGEQAAESVMKNTPAMPIKVSAVITGEVVAIDKTHNELKVKDEVTGKKYTVSAMNADVLASLERGARVRISFPDENHTSGTVFKS